MNRHILIYGGISLVVVLGYMGLMVKDKIWQPDSLPPFVFSQINHSKKSFSNGDIKGEWTLIHFWASWCQICDQDRPMLAALQKRPLKVISILTNDSVEAALSSKKWKLHSYPVLIDEKGDLLSRLGLSAVPSTILVNPVGEIVYRIEGLINPKDMKNLNTIVKKES